MAFCKSPRSQVNSFSALFKMVVCFLPVISPANSLTFDLPKLESKHQNAQIKVFNGSYITDQGLQLTTNERNEARELQAGRATYSELLHLWDNETGNLTDFDTHFSFVIDSLGNSRYADGIAFFLLDPTNGSANVTPGGAMGLPIRPGTPNGTSPFVAVEFDTFYNTDWDPDVPLGTHIGIDINSLNSNYNALWYANITHGIENEASISYDSSSKILSVVVTSTVNNITVETGSLRFTIDLRVFLPEKVEIGFSAATGVYFETNNVKSWRFNSSLVVDEKVGNNNNKGLVVGLSVGSSVLVVGLALLGFGLWKRSRAKGKDDSAFDFSMDSEFETGTGPKKFLYGQLCRATNNFAEEQKLGEGGFGGVYGGFLRELNSYVAVKRISEGSKQGIKEYASEVKIISRLRHRNLVQLVGWCHEKRELLLVYEFMENGSLDSHLFKGKTLLTWATRYKIAHGLASALLYLHEGWEQCVVHRDIKSSNVMLDSGFNAKLGDFRLARFVDHEKGSQTTVLAGTRGYMAPEYLDTGRASKESDVYSFGVVALEIACGRKPIEPKLQESQMVMVKMVWDLYGAGILLEAVDPKISTDFDEQQMECLMIVGLWCAHPDHTIRPSIKQAIQVLDFEAPLPILPPKMPVPTYFAPPASTSTTSSAFSLTYGGSVSESNPIQSSSYSCLNTDSSKLSSNSAASSPSASLLYTK